MKPITLFFIAHALLFTSCDLTTIEEVFKTEEKPPQCTLVYMDFSSSQNDKSITSMIDKLTKIIENQPNDQTSKYVIKVIHKDNSNESIIVKEIQAMDKNYKERDLHRKELDKVKVEMKEQLMAYYTEEKKSKSLHQETCICNSLDNSQYFLSALDEKTEVRVIIFSDMFEECSAKSSYLKFNFFMCDYRYRSIDTATINERIREQYIPNFNLKSRLDPENLYFITTSNPSYNNVPAKCLNPNEVKGIWKLLCEKLGYSLEDFENKIYYGNEIPDRLIQKEAS